MLSVLPNQRITSHAAMQLLPGPKDRGKPSVRFGETMMEDPYVLDFTADITDEIVYTATNALLKIAQEKRANQDNGSLKMIINSPGGSITQGYKLSAMLRQMPFPLDLIVMGQASSMAVTLLMTAGKDPRVFIDRYAKLMVHQPWVEKIGGNAEEIANKSREITRARDRIDRLISQKTGLPMAKVREMTSSDCYIYPLQALKLGLVDYVLLQGNQAVSREAVAHMKDAEISRRDEENDYDDLPTVEIDPRFSNPRAQQAQPEQGIDFDRVPHYEEALPSGEERQGSSRTSISSGQPYARFHLSGREGLLGPSRRARPEETRQPRLEIIA